MLSHGAKRVLPLKVSGPFHSPFLQEAGNRLEETLREISWKETVDPVHHKCNGSSPVLETDKIQELLVRQVASPVRWQQSMERMIAEGVDTFIEIGPGNTLRGFLKKIDRNVKVCSVNTWKHWKKVWRKRHEFRGKTALVTGASRWNRARDRSGIGEKGSGRTAQL